MRAVITDYGAAGDGSQVNTSPIQAAVDACVSNGGGTVVVPRGVFVTGSVELKSHITLHLEQGATLRGSGDLADYPPNGFRHNEFRDTRSLLYAIGCSDIRITGDGEIDLNDDPFMYWDRIKRSPETERDVPLDGLQLADAVVENRPRPTQPIFFHDCRRVRLDGITIRKSPSWTVTVSTSSDVKIHGITIDNNLRVPNNDGIHFCACRDVIVTDSVFYCGDDCIAVTGITNWEGVSERIVIADCTMTSHSAAVRLGHLRSKVRDVVLTNLAITDSNRGIGIFAGDDGFVENVVASNLIISTRLVAGAWWGKGEPLVICAADSSSGRIEGISVTNVRARVENPIIIVGDKGNVRNVALSDWDMSISYGGNRELFKPVLDLQPAAVRPAPDPNERIPWLYAQDAAGIRLRNIRACRDLSERRTFAIEAAIRDVHGLEEVNVVPGSQ